MSAEGRTRRLNAIGVIAVAVVAAMWLLASNGVLGPVDFSDPNGPDPRLKDKQASAKAPSAKLGRLRNVRWRCHANFPAIPRKL